MVGKKRRRQTTSVKAILVRDYNWRMGNLRRIYHSLWGMQDHNRDTIQQVVAREEAEQKILHEKRLEAILPENLDKGWAHEMMTEDPILSTAIWRMFRNIEENERDFGSL